MPDSRGPPYSFVNLTTFTARGSAGTASVPYLFAIVVAALARLHEKCIHPSMPATVEAGSISKFKNRALLG